MSTPPPPDCPITGLPAVRLVQTVPARLLGRLWKAEFGANAWPSFGEVNQFGLWESPTGLLFFDPPVEGDHEFYEGFYSRLKKLGLYSDRFIRPEFNLGARHVPAGARVLDVGCGLGNFRHCVTHADYTGLDPHFAEQGGDPSIRNETIADHLVANAASYDAVCAFQVLEHISAPAALFREMLRAAKPGGLVCIGVPHVPSALTRIPNFLMNAPPHHLSWWTKEALAELAKRAGAIVESVEKVPGARTTRCFTGSAGAVRSNATATHIIGKRFPGTSRPPSACSGASPRGRRWGFLRGKTRAQGCCSWRVARARTKERTKNSVALACV